MKFKFIKLLLIFVVHNTASCQNKEVAKAFYSVEELKQDFGVFRASLEEGHPALYRYGAKQKLDSLFATIKTNITKQMTGREFTVLLGKVAAQIGDGHLKVMLPKTDKDKLDGGKTAIPFSLYWQEDKLFVRRNFSILSDKEFLGAEIISINGHLITDFLKDYLSVAASDGNNLTNKYRMLQRARPFPRYFNYLYGYTETYEVTYIPVNEQSTRTSKLEGISFDDFFKAYEKQVTSIAPAEFNILNAGQYAYLRVSSFDKEQFQEKKINFEKFLETSFKALFTQNISHLILDVRGNGGGTDEYGKILFSYFANQHFDYYESIKMNKESFNFFKHTSQPNRKAPKGMLKANVEGTYDNIQHPNIGQQQPKQTTFKGTIYVLIDGGCFSTTSEFLSMLHFHTKAIFIGEESGGGYYGNSSGPTPEFILPNSKVSIEMPLMKYTMAVKDYPYKDRGLMPNHVIIPKIKDKIENKDVELEFAKSLIK